MELTLLFVVAALMIGVAVGGVGRAVLVRGRIQAARQQVSQILEGAELEKKELLLQAKSEASQTRNQAERDIRDRRSEIHRQERRHMNREENLGRQTERMQSREQAIIEREKETEKTQKEIEQGKAEGMQRLEAISGLSVPQAQEVLFKKAEDEMTYDLARRFRDLEVEARQKADQQARRIITLAINRLASSVVQENTTNVIPLPSDDMKGRIIGREGRNIRAIEQATGVDVIIDDTPEAVTISCFDPVRRQVARVAMLMLIKDGRIHPARVEDIVERARKEVDEEIWKAGEEAVFESGVRGLSPELITLLGRLKYRYSYGENILQHSVEVSHVAGMMAAELGANQQVAKAGGLLHDIGKALTHEVEGPHAEIGAEVARRYGIPYEVERAIMEHHDDEMGSVEAFLVSAADAVSAARPGVRKDTSEHYVKRLEALESVANSFDGVEKTYAVQAGREVRIMVKPDAVDDVGAAKLAHDVVKKIEETLVYPGQIKVMVIRESRNVEYAR